MFGNDERMLKAVDAMSEGDWALAYQLLKKLTDIGVPDAEHFMGWFYEQGTEVKQSDIKAFHWFSKAAANGVPESQNAIASMYSDGCGTELNLEKAYFWYSVAYKNGDSASLVELKTIEQKLSTEQLLTLKNDLSNIDDRIFSNKSNTD